MRNMAFAVLLLSVVYIAPPSLAASPSQSPELSFQRLPPGESRALLSRWRNTLAARSTQPSINVVKEDRWHHSFAIPSAGHLQGGSGTFFRSDITLSNQHFDRSQQVVILWLERAIDNSDTDVGVVVSLDPGEIITVRDAVDELFGISGLGSLLFFAVDSNLDLDELAAIDGYSRIWTPQPGNPNGTVSQQFPAVDADMLLDWEAALAIGIRHDNGFRSNVGIVNFDDIARTWDVTVIGEAGGGTSVPVTVPPFSMMHVAVPPANLGNVFIEYRLQGDATDVSWLAYATSNDNITGDGWVAVATPQREDAPF